MSSKEKDEDDDEKEIDEEMTLNDDNEFVEYEPLSKSIRTDVSWCKDYDINETPENFVMLVCAIRRSGKTVLVHDFFYHLRHRFDTAHLFSPTYELQKLDGERPIFYFIPKGNRYNEFDEEKLQGIIDKQKEIYLANERLPKNMRREPKCLIILDDILSDPECLHSPAIKNLCVNGR